MLKALSSIGLALAIIIGGGAVAASASQDSLPDETLYPVKLFLEDTKLNLTSDPDNQVELLIGYANKRVDEAVAMIEQGDVVPAEVMVKLQTDLKLMLKIAEGMDGENHEQTLQHIRENLRTQAYLMTMLNQPDDVDPSLEQLRSMLRVQHRLVELKLDEQLKFHQGFNNNKDETAGSQDGQPEPQGNQNKDCIESGDCEPSGDGQKSGSESGGNGSGSDTQGNPEPGNTDPGNADPGTGEGNTDPSNTDPGNTDPGNTNPGYVGSGDPDPGDPDPGDPDPGDPDPGDPDPGEGDPGNPDPGNLGPGNTEPGNPEPGKGSGD